MGVRKISTWRDPYGMGFDTCEKEEVEIHSGLTVLVGCNGIGKTTMLKYIEDELRKEKIPYLKLDNSSGQGRRDTISNASFNEDYATCATAIYSSEGESINITLGQFLPQVRNFITTGQKEETNPFVKAILGDKAKKKITSDERWILLDGIDSGYSIDNVLELKEVIKLMKEDATKQGKDLYVVASANEYELANGEDCFDVLKGEYIKFSDYEDYKQFILHTFDEKSKREYREDD